MLIWGAVLFGLAPFAGSASAQSTNWTNSGLGGWNIDSNWSYAVPNYGLSVFIPEGTALISSQSAVSYTLSLGTGGLLNGSIIISNGGNYINVGGSSIGTYAGANSAVTVSGANSLWQTDFLTVGGDNFSNNGGSGTLRVENGGWVRMNYGRLGAASGSNGSVIVTGANSLWQMYNLSVGGVGTAASGYNGAGSLQIASSGKVLTGHLQVFDTGAAQVNNGSSTVSGLTVAGGAVADPWGGSEMTSTPLGALTVGNTASGRMVVQTGGTVANSFATIGASLGTVGSVLVDGAGSTWTSTDQLAVGLGGTGTLEVRNGATLKSVRGFAGANAFSSGTITVSDPGSTWNASGSFFIGNSGSGSLQVLNGGVVTTAGNSHLAFTAGATADVNVSGAGSTLNTAVLLNIGGDSAVARGTASVRIADGATVNVGSATNLYSTGRLDLVNATTFTGDINAFGGLIRTAGNTTLANAVHLGTSGVSIDNLNPGTNCTVSGNIDGAGGLTKTTVFGITGLGTLTLNGANTYSGPTAVNAGTLLVNGSITSATTVNSGATLGGSGTIAANVMNSGIVAPGNSPGALHITGSYFQNAGGRLKIELGSPIDFDRLAVTGNVTLGGTLEISLVNGFTPSVNQTFDILSGGSFAGAFSSVILPSQEGLVWDTSQLSTGMISVAVAGLPFAEGDFNEDRDVDADDLEPWRNNFGTLAGGSHMQGDADTDGAIDGADLLVWQRQLESPASQPIAASVPEPSALALIGALAACGLARLRRRRN